MIAIVTISGYAKTNETIGLVENDSLNISSQGMTFPAYLAAPTSEGKWPGINSFIPGS
jgi:hypothetical protein